MKICKKCSAYNSDERYYCVDCGERLGNKITSEDEEAIKVTLDEKLFKIDEDSDGLSITLFYKIAGIGSIVVAVSLVVIYLVFYVPVKVDMDMNILFGVVSSISAIATAFLSKLNWGLTKLKLSMTINNADEATPSWYYGFSRKVGTFIFSIVGLICLLLSIKSIVYPSREQLTEYMGAVASYTDETYPDDDLVLKCIETNPKLWNRIINYGDRAAELYILELEQPENYISNLQEELMMSAIAEIKDIDKDDIVINKKSNLIIRTLSDMSESSSDYELYDYLN